MIFCQAKYKGTRQPLGFCLPGMQFYNTKAGKWVKYGKDFGYKLLAADVPPRERLDVNLKIIEH